MPETYDQCPKCGHKPAQPLSASEACPACGIYPFKWRSPARAPVEMETDEAFPSEDEAGFIASLLQPMNRIDSMSFYGRCIVLAFLAVWSWFLFGYDYRIGAINMSFMHNILLPIHEAGHVLFSPFGEFLMILGGSLFQLALPFAICLGFILKNRDNFGASVGLWWTSVSLVDLSPYIYDALHPQLVLTGGSIGNEDGRHDWVNLLSRFGQLTHAQGLGAFAHVLGGLAMLAALLWGATILLRQRTQLGDSVA